METKSLKTLEFNKILLMLAEFARNDGAKEKALSLVPSANKNVVQRTLFETDAAVQMLLKYGSPELVHIDDTSAAVKHLAVGGTLSAHELLNIANVLKGARLFGKYTAEQTGILNDYISELMPDKKLEEKIFTSIISDDEIADAASVELAAIRRKTRNASQKIRNILDNMIHSQHYRKFLQDPIVTVRNDRYVIPVRSEYRSEIRGITHDMSSSGSTVFIEPEGVVNANNELHELSVREAAEIEKILSELSAKAAEISESIDFDYDTLIHLDFVFAKARFALDLKATMPELSDRAIVIKQGRHPLIDRKKIVPVDIELGLDYDTLIVTGPNTGGKTVVLKTVGLFCLMAQSGLLLPAADGTEISVRSDIFADIGDEQSIEQSLSTFSSHMKNIIEISEKAEPDALVLFDELGAGTDPTEGAALATAIIESFRRKNVLIAATTHYSELKLYALSTDGVENASCEFDVNTLSPTYRLLTGVPGKSNAFAISEKLGLDKSIIERSKEMLSSENIKFEDVLSKIELNRLSAEKNFEETRKLRKEADELRRQLAAERNKIEREKDKIYDRARAKAEKIITHAQEDVEKMYDDMKEAQKAHNDAEALRQLRELRKDLGLKLQKNVPPGKAKPKPHGNVNINTLKLGASVILNDIGDTGSVLSVNKKDKTAVIQVGIMKVTSHIDNLSLADDGEKKASKPKSTAQASGGIRRDSVKSEIDLRGMMLQDAEYATDKFLDECAIAGLSTVSIIHGKGTGTLRTGIQAMLRRHPHVKSFRLGRYGEGENGVTIVELK